MTALEQVTFATVPLEPTQATIAPTSGLVRKKILRTGEWPVTPTTSGVQRKPLRITLHGVSDQRAGVISLAELKRNFEANVIPNVNVPLSDDANDHKNLTHLNKGFVRKLEIEREGDHWYLTALMAITDRETQSRMIDGTYADCSAGVAFGIERKGQRYGAVLDHVCITNQPFIDGLGPFMATFSSRPASAFREPTAAETATAARGRLAAAQAERRARWGPVAGQDRGTPAERLFRGRPLPERVAAMKESLRPR